MLKGKISKRSVFAAMMLAALVACLLGRRVADPLRSAAAFALAPLGDPMMYLAGSVQSRLEGAGVRSLSPDEARRLQDENDLLRAELQRVAEQLQQTREQLPVVQGLRGALYGRKGDFPCEIIPARVVGSAGLPYGQTRLLASGEAAGVPAGARVTTADLLTDRSRALPAGLPVVSTEALVGRVARSGRYTAVLELLTDRNFQTSGAIWRNIDNARQIRAGSAWQKLTPENNRPVAVHVKGDGREAMVASEVLADHNILPGDLLKTLGDEAFLPQEVLIGVVRKVQPDPHAAARVMLTIEPLARLDLLRDVYIVLPLTDSSRRGAD
jgi:cell shape-determining protein MreC